MISDFMEIIGYKCFNKDMTNRYNIPFEIGCSYQMTGKIKFGNYGNGFHMCKNLEDTLRYFDYENNDIAICLVKGSGNIVEHADEYYGYYEMYAVEKIEIIRLLTREEIINYALNLKEIRIKKFINCFKLTKEEIILFKERYKDKRDVLEYIIYYQETKRRKLIKNKKES